MKLSAIDLMKVDYEKSGPNFTLHVTHKMIEHGNLDSSKMHVATICPEGKIPYFETALSDMTGFVSINNHIELYDFCEKAVRCPILRFNSIDNEQFLICHIAIKESAAFDIKNYNTIIISNPKYFDITSFGYDKRRHQIFKEIINSNYAGNPILGIRLFKSFSSACDFVITRITIDEYRNRSNYISGLQARIDIDSNIYEKLIKACSRDITNL